jgi:hypothetical protein
MCALRQLGRNHLHFEENLNMLLFKLFVSPGCKQKNQTRSISIKVIYEWSQFTYFKWDFSIFSLIFTSVKPAGTLTKWRNLHFMSTLNIMANRYSNQTNNCVSFLKQIRKSTWAKNIHICLIWVRLFFFLKFASGEGFSYCQVNITVWRT